MQALTTWLDGGGLVMYLLLFGLAPIVAISGLLHLILASRKSLVQVCLCLALVLVVGLVATGVQRSRVANALEAARPDERLHLAVAGYGEASRPFQLSLAVGLAGLLPFTLGELRRKGGTPAQQALLAASSGVGKDTAPNRWE